MFDVQAPAINAPNVPMSNLSKIPIHVIDFEGSRQSGIVEYGVVTLLGDKMTAAQTRICAPIGTISDQDRLQHGISEDIAGQEARFDTDWSYFAGLRETGPLCAHSATVEDGLLRSVWSYPRRSPNFAREGEFVATWGPWVDTLQIYRSVYPKLSSYKLSDLIAAFELQTGLDELAELYCPEKRRRFHCALYDAFASALLLKRLCAEPELAPVSLHWLFLQSASTSMARNSVGQLDLF